MLTPPFGLSLSKPCEPINRAQDRPFDRLKVNGVLWDFSMNYRKRSSPIGLRRQSGTVSQGWMPSASIPFGLSLSKPCKPFG